MEILFKRIINVFKIENLKEQEIKQKAGSFEITEEYKVMMDEMIRK